MQKTGGWSFIVASIFIVAAGAAPVCEPAALSWMKVARERPCQSGHCK